MNYSDLFYFGGALRPPPQAENAGFLMPTSGLQTSDILQTAKNTCPAHAHKEYEASQAREQKCHTQLSRGRTVVRLHAELLVLSLNNIELYGSLALSLQFPSDCRGTHLYMPGASVIMTRSYHRDTNPIQPKQEACGTDAPRCTYTRSAVVVAQSISVLWSGLCCFVTLLLTSVTNCPGF